MFCQSYTLTQEPRQQAGTKLSLEPMFLGSKQGKQKKS